MTFLRRHSVRLIQIVIVIAAVPAVSRTMRFTRAPRFADSGPRSSAGTPLPSFSAELLPATTTAFVHASTIAQLADGDLLAAWYGGSNEARQDVAIFISRCDHRTGVWSPAQAIEERGSTEAAIGTRVKSVGNPVLFTTPDGVSLFFTSILVGGWSGGTICVKHSADGVNWSPAKRLYTATFFNVGMLVRGKPWLYEDGSVALPVYHQLATRWSAVARVRPDSSVVDLVRIDHRMPLIQPWIVPITSSRAVAFMRWSSRVAGPLTLTTSDDGGAHWSPVFGTRLIHRDSAVAAAQLSDGSLVAVYNNTIKDRRGLSIARSTDGGLHWSRQLAIERDLNPDELIVRREYSYPYLLQTNDGMIHLVYTWQRSRIRHLTFNEAWLFSQPELMSVRP